MKRKLIVIGALLVALTGCTVRNQDLSHTPLLERGKPKHIELVVCNFEDVRENQKSVGAYYLYGIPVAKVESPSEFSQAITEAFKKELKHAGYRVIDESQEGRYKIMGKVIHYFAKQGLSASSKIEMEIALYDGSALLFKKIYENQTSNFLGSDHQTAVGFQQILNALTEDLNQTIVRREER